MMMFHVRRKIFPRIVDIARKNPIIFLHEI